MPQRSAIIFWLLLAATLSVDAVVFSWMASEPYPDPLYAVVTFDALILGQLSVVCIWSTITVTTNLWVRLAPIVAVVTAALLTATLVDEPVMLSSSFTNHLAYYGLHVALLVTSIWLLQRTEFWRRRSGASREWQYSIAHLLIAMTVVAVLAAAMRNSVFFSEDRWINIAFACSSVGLTVAVVSLWSLSWHWLLRLAGALGFAVLLGFAFALALVVASNDRLAPNVGAHYLLQVIVLSIWLGCGPILPVAQFARFG